MKKYLFRSLVSSLILISASASGADPEFKLSDQFKMKQAVLAWGTDFNLQDSRDGHSLGKVTQDVLNWTKTFMLTNSSDETVARAKQKFFSWGATSDVYDQSGNKIATIKQQIFKSLFKASTTYSILDGSGREIATSEKFEFLATDFTLRDRDGNVVATMHRPAINLVSDTWNVTIERPGAIDPRIIPFIPAFKKAVDAERRKNGG